MNNSELLTYIAKGTKITANIESDQDVHLSGELTGDIRSVKKFVLTPTGILNGTVKAENADISGTVDGEVRVKGHLSIQSGAKVKGSIIANKLEVQSGAQIDAKVQTGPDAGSKPATPKFSAKFTNKENSKEEVAETSEK